ncbi:MAG: hypothetical protein K9M10_01205 [Candidatus Pacebacteria bacterium]|nr:hypothetical protein [Candidatus Paceibacterota bacterium]MCF7857081.1 hypothetical protein [Candidatus Paceibacterota bacterium]
MILESIPEISLCHGVVLYVPFFNEPDLLPLSMLYRSEDSIVTPNDSHIDPIEWADTCIKFAKGRRMCVLVPGTAFDSSGTRHGRGGGWYDRFLSRIPKGWLRIGVATPMSFKSGEVLKRQPWDEQVDYIFIYKPKLTSWDVCEALPKRFCIDM